MGQTVPPVIGAAQFNSDDEHLRLLSLFHYILGGFHLLVSFFFIFHFAFGLFMVLNPAIFGNNPPPVPLKIMGLLMTVVTGFLMLIGCTVGICTFLCGHYISRRTHRTFTIVIAAINCLSFPFGTALGIFTLIVLSRESVQALYKSST